MSALSAIRKLMPGSNHPLVFKDANQPNCGIVSLSLESILRSRYSIRDISREDQRLWDLAESIKMRGLLQPIIVAPLGPPNAGSFELLAGYRRFKAVEMLGKKVIDAIIYDGTEPASCFFAENEHRESLPPMTRALATAMLMKEFGGTQDDLAKRLNCNRTEIADDLAISKLPKEIRDQAIMLGHDVSKAQLIEVAQCRDTIEQSALWNRAMQGASRDELRTAKRERKTSVAASCGQSLAAAVKSVRSITQKLANVDLSSANDNDKAYLLELKVAAKNFNDCIAGLEK